MKANLLKIIGVVLFIWVMSKIDRADLANHLASANWLLLIAAFFVQYLVYFIKTIRWHVFVRSAEVQTSVWESWKLCNIGNFLANITPGKVGEFGKSAYLLQAGVPKAHAVGLVILDRLMDVMVILIIAIASIGILFGWVWSLAGLAVASLLLPLISWLIIGSITTRNTLDFFGLQRFIPSLSTLTLTLILTLLSWFTYFAWAIIIARGVGIHTPMYILVAAFTLTGVLSLLPIAPSGLGTREAALITLLTPYSVDDSQLVALGILMFTILIAGNSLGLLYWISTPHSASFQPLTDSKVKTPNLPSS